MIRVLVVDDHEVVLTGLTALLGCTGDLVCVGTATDGDEALAEVERSSPDVVLLDLSMRGRDGLSVVRALRDAGRDVGVLVLTSFQEPERVLEVLQAGADGYLLKDTQAERILDGVRSVAAGGAPLDPTVARCLLGDLRQQASTDGLTDREREVLELVRQGLPNKSIARRLHITERTVKAHVTNILQRLGVSDRTQAALWAERHLGPEGVPGA
ncbi:MAG: two component transcriptional regulator, LuxR family [Modestobacter sp.]|nr:two component transcriptional regulator, LuxR family [Modestobacter sp.]MCW2620241.1 two component transcriptional regulator, LuxR family [Modestobacter sp.]